MPRKGLVQTDGPLPVVTDLMDAPRVNGLRVLWNLQLGGPSDLWARGTWLMRYCDVDGTYGVFDSPGSGWLCEGFASWEWLKVTATVVNAEDSFVDYDLHGPLPGAEYSWWDLEYGFEDVGGTAGGDEESGVLAPTGSDYLDLWFVSANTLEEFGPGVGWHGPSGGDRPGYYTIPHAHCMMKKGAGSSLLTWSWQNPDDTNVALINPWWRIRPKFICTEIVGP